MTSGSRQVLLVDDDDIDRLKFIRTFRRLGKACEMFEAQDGIEALSYLQGTVSKHTINRPYVIVLDLSMPRMDGIEFLDAIRTDPLLRESIVFVLSTSSSEPDRRAAYARNVAGYIVKSGSSPEFEEVVTLIDRYLDVVELP